MHFCTVCDTKIEEGNRFCTHCGEKIEQPTIEEAGGSPNQPPIQNQPAVDSTNWKATVGLALGIMSILLCRVSSLGILLGVLGIIFGAMGLRSKSKRKEAGWGLGLGIAGIVSSVITWMWGLVLDTCHLHGC